MKDCEFWKKHKKAIILCAILTLFVPLILVHLLFKWHSKVEFWAAEWSAGELLEYIGTMLTFLGTMVLSYLALRASLKANELSKKVIDLEQNQYMLELRPFALVSNWKAYEISASELVDDPQKKYIQIGEYKTDVALGIELELTNTTQSCISVQYSCGTARNPEYSWTNAAVNQENLKMTLSSEKSDRFVFYASPSFMEKQIGQRVTVELILENRFSKRYKETFVLIVTSLTNKVSMVPEKWFCHLAAQEYSISRFEKDKNGQTICIQETL